MFMYPEVSGTELRAFTSGINLVMFNGSIRNGIESVYFVGFPDSSPEEVSGTELRVGLLLFSLAAFFGWKYPERN